MLKVCGLNMSPQTPKIAGIPEASPDTLRLSVRTYARTDHRRARRITRL